MDFIPPILVWVLLLAFFWEFVDISAGMGYGTAMSPILLLMDFTPLEIVPALLISNVGVGIMAWFAHQKFQNVNLSKTGTQIVLLHISLAGLAAVLVGVWVAISLPQNLVIGYTGVLITSIGIFTLFRKKWEGDYSKWRILGLSFFAAFNKVLTGGGFGPIVVGGQLYSGIESRRAVGIASMAEGLTSLTGALLFLLVHPYGLNWSLTISLLIGSVVAVPLAALFISKIPEIKHRSFIGVVCVVIGMLALCKLVFF